MRYMISNRRIPVLMDIAMAGTTEGHYPEDYQVWADLTLHARWGSTRCSCGVSERVWWQPETETYLELLVKAWKSLPCYVEPSAMKVEVVIVPQGEEELSVVRGPSLLRVLVPRGLSGKVRSQFAKDNLSTVERQMLRSHLGLPSASDEDVIEEECIDWSRGAIFRGFSSSSQ